MDVGLGPCISRGHLKLANFSCSFSNYGHVKYDKKHNRVWRERPATLLFKGGDPPGRKFCAWEMRGAIPQSARSRRALIKTTELELCALYTVFFDLPETLRTNDATTVLFLGGQKGDSPPIITWKKEEQNSRQTAGQRGCRPDGGWDNISSLKANLSSIPLTRMYLCMYRVFMGKKGENHWSFF